jgi:predicted nucleic acid-binding protein
MYLIDSNVVIDYLKGMLPPKGIHLVNSIVDDTLLLSVITKIEVLGFGGKPESDRLLKEFVDNAVVLDLNSSVVDQTIHLRKTHKIKLGDAIIGATAIVYSLILVTRNVDDFKKIPGFRILNPWE